MQPKIQNVGILVFNEVEVLDFCGPYEVFSIANECRTRKIFDIQLISTDDVNLKGRNKFKFEADFTIESHPSLDILIIPGGPGTRQQECNTRLIQWLENQFQNLKYLLTICTGARIIAHTTFIQDAVITTHWNSLKELKQINPDINVVDNVRYTDNGKILTSAGVSSGIDLCFYFLEKHFDRNLSKNVAKYIEWNKTSSLVASNLPE